MSLHFDNNIIATSCSMDTVLPTLIDPYMCGCGIRSSRGSWISFLSTTAARPGFEAGNAGLSWSLFLIRQLYVSGALLAVDVRMYTKYVYVFNS